MSAILKSILRKKRTQTQRKTKSELSNCLTTWDLTSLGVGATLGAGTYVVSGQVAATIAGPSVIISFAIAALASILSGLCYAEFGARVPKTTGSAYAYSYVTVGELAAYIIGWNLILEYMIGTAADARALSGCVDYVFGHAIKNFTVQHLGQFTVPILGTYPDIMSFVVTIIVTTVLAIGVKQSSAFSAFFNVLNLLVVLFIIITGLFFIDKKNWFGGRGFFPYGFSGVLSGAATCFYAFVGFDIIATTGEEAKNAPRSIPIAIVSSLLIVFVCYFGVSSIVTLMVPFDQLDAITPIPTAFGQRGLHWATYIIGIGAVCGLSSSLLGSQFPLPRIIYAMSSDGLLFKFFSKVSAKTEIPINATIWPGILTAVFAMVFNLKELIEMMSIGTLLAYTLVSLSVLILRYQPDDDDDVNWDDDHFITDVNEIVIEEESICSEDSFEFRFLPYNDVTKRHDDVTKRNDDVTTDTYDSTHDVVKNKNEQSDVNAEVVHDVTKNSIYSNGRRRSQDAAGFSRTESEIDLFQRTLQDSIFFDNDEEDEKYKLRDDVELTSRHSDENTELLTHRTKKKPGKRIDKTSEIENIPTKLTGKIVSWAVLFLFLLFFGFSSLMIFGFEAILDRNYLVISFTMLFGALSILCIGIIAAQPQSKKTLAFKTPLVPALPITAMFFNIILMLKLSTLTWIRFGVWMALGMLIYVFYGVWQSKVRQGVKKKTLSPIFMMRDTGTEGIEIEYEAEVIPAHREWNAEKPESEWANL